MKNLLPLVSLIFLSQSLFSQNMTTEGFIVLQAGDTIKGTIKDMEWQKNPTSVDFKGGNESTFKTYSIAEIKAFATARPIYYEVHSFKYDGDMIGKKIDDYPLSRVPAKLIETTACIELIL